MKSIFIEKRVYKSVRVYKRVSESVFILHHWCVDKSFLCTTILFFYMYMYLYISLYMNYTHFYIIVRAVHSLCVLHCNEIGKNTEQKKKRKTTKNHPNWPHWNKCCKNVSIHTSIKLNDQTTLNFLFIL